MSSAFSAVVAEEGRDDVREDGRDEDGPPPPPSIEAAVGMAGVDGCRTEEEFGRPLPLLLLWRWPQLLSMC